VIKSFDPGTGDGVILCDTDFAEYDLAVGALAGSPFRMLRQGQRVVFELDAEGLATQLRVGAESDMGTPGFPQPTTSSPSTP
jgi:CspA family cold shock protein